MIEIIKSYVNSRHYLHFSSSLSTLQTSISQRINVQIQSSLLSILYHIHLNRLPIENGNHFQIIFIIFGLCLLSFRSQRYPGMLSFEDSILLLHLLMIFLYLIYSYLLTPLSSSYLTLQVDSSSHLNQLQESF